MPLRGGGVGPLMANAILNFHFDFLTPSLIRNEKRMYSKKATPILVLDFFQANLFYFILKMSTLKGVQAWPQQSLCSSSLERWFTCATPCLRRWYVSYSPRLIKGIYGAKKIIHNFFFLQFSSSMIGRRVSVPLCSNIWYLKQASPLLPVMSCFSLSIRLFSIAQQSFTIWCVTSKSPLLAWCIHSSESTTFMQIKRLALEQLLSSPWYLLLLPPITSAIRCPILPKPR